MKSASSSSPRRKALKTAPPDPLANRLLACYTGALYDVLRAEGYPNQALPPTIRPLVATQKIAGKVFTVEGHLIPCLDGHQTLIHWTKMLSRAPAGSVVVCQPNDSTIAHMGELSSETMQLRGVRGYIVDGGCRDTGFIRRIGFPVYCRYQTPVDVVGRWQAERFDEPIKIGAVDIHPGDYVLADEDGVVFIPSAIVGKIIDMTEKVMRTESKVRKAILAGVDPHEAYLKYGKF